jgi:hypothetical protein
MFVAVVELLTHFIGAVGELITRWTILRLDFSFKTKPKTIRYLSCDGYYFLFGVYVFIVV